MKYDGYWKVIATATARLANCNLILSIIYFLDATRACITCCCLSNVDIARSSLVRLCFTGEDDRELDTGPRESRGPATLGRRTSSCPRIGPILPLPFSTFTLSNFLVGGGKGSNRSSLPRRMS